MLLMVSLKKIHTNPVLPIKPYDIMIDVFERLFLVQISYFGFNVELLYLPIKRQEKSFEFGFEFGF